MRYNNVYFTKSMCSHILFAFLLLFISSCSDKYSETDLLKDIMDNNSDGIAENIYKLKDQEEEYLKEVLSLYNEKIVTEGLKPLIYEEGVSFKKRPRKGFNFVNEYNNIEASITYKEVAVEGDTLLNYLDFRMFDNRSNLCIKIPSLAKIKCTLYPTPFPISSKDLDSNYPIVINGVDVYHTQMMREIVNADKNRGVVKDVIQLNIDNYKIKKNINSIVEKIKQDSLLEKYYVTVYNSPSDPTTYISYSSDENEKDANVLFDFMLETVPEEIDIVKTKINENQLFEIISIGGVGNVKKSGVQFF